MTDEFTTTKALGWIDAEPDAEGLRAGADLSRHGKAVRRWKRAFSTKLLDPSIKMDASKVKK